MIAPNGKLTQDQQKTLALIEDHADRPIAALGVRDIMQDVGYSSTSVASHSLKVLERAGYIRLHQMKARQIELVRRGPSPQQQVKALLDLIDEATADIDRIAGQFKRRDPDMHRKLSDIAASLRETAAEATGAGA